MATTVQQVPGNDRSPRVREFDGPERLIEAVEALFENEVDVVAVRGLASQPQLQARLTGLARELDTVDEFFYIKSEFSKYLYESIPAFKEVDQLVAGYWQQHGYGNYQPQRGKKDRQQPHLFPGQARRGGLSSRHVDFLKEARRLRTRTLVGPLSLSVCIEGRGVYFAERLNEDLTLPDGSFDRPAFVEAGTPQNFPRELRSRTRQGQWDGVLFLNHPHPTIHYVLADGSRRAALFDYHVERL